MLINRPSYIVPEPSATAPKVDTNELQRAK